MVLENPERYNFYKYENSLKKGKEDFIKLLDEILKTDGLDYALSVLKSSGLSVNLFKSKAYYKLFYEVLDHISSQIDSKDLKRIEDFKLEIKNFESVFSQFEQIRNDYLKEYETILATILTSKEISLVHISVPRP
jgi:hypothetical protein